MTNKKIDTKLEIKKAFTKLLNIKGFNSLTVSDITREANINRGTFYLHYIDKFDLMDKLQDQTVNDITEIILKSSYEFNNDPKEIIPYHSILEALKYVITDFEFIKSLTSDSGNNQFVQNFKNILENLVFSLGSKYTNLNFSMKGLPLDYAKEILLSSSVSIIMLWIKKGAIETPEEIAKMLSQSKELSPYELLL